MANARAERVLDQSTTLAGTTAAVVMDGVTSTGGQTLLAAFPANKAAMRVLIWHDNTSEWELVDGPWTAGTSTFTRTTVRASSNGGALVSFTAGVKYVAIVPTAYDLDHIDALDGTIAGQVSLGGAAGAESLRVLAVASAVNRIEASGAIAGSAVQLAAVGNDVNIGLNLVSKGSGAVQVNGQSLSLAGALATAAAFTTAGAFAVTLTATGATNVTLPTSGTLLASGGALGTPASGTLTNCTGLPISTGVSGLGSGIAAFLASASSANLLAAITDETGTGALVFANTPTLVTPNIGAATGTSLAATGAITSSGTAGIGYAAGAGGTVTQATNKSTGVTLSKTCGDITLNSASLAAGTIVSFVLTNTTISATDILNLNHISGGTAGAYGLNAQCAAGSATINVRNNTSGALAEAIVIRFSVGKAANT